LRHKDIELELEESARDLLIKKGYDPVYGARPMRRTVEQMVQDPLAEEILRGHIRPGERVKVGVDKESLIFYQGSAEKLLKNHQSNIENAPVVEERMIRRLGETDQNQSKIRLCRVRAMNRGRPRGCEERRETTPISLPSAQPLSGQDSPLSIP
jgi:hypothetical protein